MNPLVAPHTELGKETTLKTLRFLPLLSCANSCWQKMRGAKARAIRSCFILKKSRYLVPAATVTQSPPVLYLCWNVTIPILRERGEKCLGAAQRSDSEEWREVSGI